MISIENKGVPMNKILMVLASLILSTQALAAVVISPGVSYSTNKAEATQPNATQSESAQTVIDARLGYVLPMGLYLGGMYSLITMDDGTDKNSGNLIGPSVGYYSMMGFYSIFTYHILGELDLDSTTKLTGAKGPQVDVGWVFPLSAYFAIGPQMTYRSVEFDKIEGTGTSIDTDNKFTGIEPYVTLLFMF